jgi:hypothetical protein
MMSDWINVLMANSHLIKFERFCLKLEKFCLK